MTQPTDTTTTRAGSRWLDGIADTTVRGTVVDVVFALGLCVMAVLLLALPYGAPTPPTTPFALATVGALACCLPIAALRRFPLAVLVVVSAAYVVYVELDVGQQSAPGVAVLTAMFGAGAFGRPVWRNRVRAAALAAILAYVVVHLVSARDQIGAALPLYMLATIPYNAFVYSAAWAMGDWYRERAVHVRELRHRAEQLERERAERERRAVLDERVRIARELHDVVAHHVSLMGVQAGAARTVLRSSPDKAADVLSSIEDSSREAVTEMHRLLGALRDGPSGEQVDVRSRLRQLDGLLDATRATGLEVRLRVRGEAPQALPETLDLSAYRIVQEALTNVVKHAGAQRATVRLTYGPDAVSIEVEDDGRGPHRSPNGLGRGLIGMRERAALFGGTLTAGPGDRGGFVVRATVPLDGRGDGA